MCLLSRETGGMFRPSVCGGIVAVKLRSKKRRGGWMDVGCPEAVVVVV